MPGRNSRIVARKKSRIMSWKKSRTPMFNRICQRSQQPTIFWGHDRTHGRLHDLHHGLHHVSLLVHPVPHDIAKPRLLSTVGARVLPPSTLIGERFSFRPKACVLLKKPTHHCPECLMWFSRRAGSRGLTRDRILTFSREVSRSTSPQNGLFSGRFRPERVDLGAQRNWWASWSN